MKEILLSSLLVLSLRGMAQRPAADAVLAAEKSFAAYSVAHGTRDAFLHFLDSNSVVFEGGKPVNGLEVWANRETRPGILNWHPVYGFLSASGEMGFTTGPWTFQPKTTSDSVVARGQYATVWKKNRRGEWQAIVDFGVNNTPAFDSNSFAFAQTTPSFIRGTWNNLLNREQKFMQATGGTTAAERRAAYEAALSKSAFLLNRNKRLPAISTADLALLMETMPTGITYTIGGSGIAEGGDLGYVYGTTVINGKTDAYLRIWRREGKEWKLALEVLPY